MGRMEGKVALVTGAAGGLGRAIASRLAREGAAVISTDIAPGPGIWPHDVTSKDAWAGVIARIEAAHGALHVLVNNAATAVAHGGYDVEQADLEDWRRTQIINVESVLIGCQAAIPLLAKSGGGSIINLSSIAGLIPTPFLTAYGLSKASVAHLTRSVALHCAQKGYKIRANSLHPGQIRTPMLEGIFEKVAAENRVSKDEAAAGFLSRIPMGDFQTADDIADAALFLASDESRMITGTQLVVDGGMTLAN